MTTTANVSVKQILLKRGTTAKNLAYTGPAGEVTIDTDLDTLRIHDGVTPGGNVVSGSGGGVSSAVTNTINANVAAANVQITSLWANAAAQATSITSLSANIVAANSAIVTANVRMKSYVDTQISGISLTPGPQGDKGDKGDKGDNGEPGSSANTGDLSFVSDAMYNLAGVIVENADLTNPATASLILPENGATGTGSDVQLNNSYSNVVIGTGTVSTLTNFWTFGTDGKLSLPNTWRIGASSSTFISNDGFANNNDLWMSGRDAVFISNGVDADYRQWMFSGNIIQLPDDGDIVRWNGSELVSVLGGGNVTTANIGTVAPSSTTGALWFDTTDGRLYVNNGDTWVDANPTVITDPSFYLGNLTITDRTINSDDSGYTFGADGTLTMPWGKIGAFGGPGLTMMANVDQNQQFTGMFVGNTGSPVQAALTLQPESAAISVSNLGTGEGYNWQFDNTGNLTIPGNINYANGVSILSGITAGSGSVSSLVNGSQTLSLNSDGTVTMPLGSVIKATTDSYTGISTSDGNTFAYVNSDGFYVSTLYTTAEYEWHFDNNGLLGLPNGAKIGSSDSNKFATDQATVGSLDLRDGTGRGFYTGDDGYTLRSNGTYNWIFGTNGGLTIPGDIISHGGNTSITFDDVGRFSNINFNTGGVSPWTMTWGNKGILTIGQELDFGANAAIIGDTDGTITLSPGAKDYVFGTDGKLTFPDGNTRIFHNPDNGILYFDSGVDGGGGISFGATTDTVIVGSQAVKIDAGFGNETTYHWTFGTNGQITTPQGGVIGDTYSDGLGTSIGAGSGENNYAGINSYTGDQWVEANSTAVYIGTNYLASGGNTWTFNKNGSLTFPNGTIQTTAWLGRAVNVGNTAPTPNIGSLWFDTVDGRTYVGSGSYWVDASPTVTPSPSYYLGNLTVDGDVIDFTNGNLTIDSTGILLVNGTEVAGTGTGNVSFNNTMLVTGAGTNVGWDHGIISLAPGNQIGSGQYINIYPTQAYDEPHIHIAAGIDNGGGDLILGPDEYHVDVNHNGNIYVRTNSQAHQWGFGADGNLTLPTGGNINYANGHSILSGITSGTNTGNITFSGSDITGTGSNVTLTANTTDWVFYANANLVLPTNATITYANGTSILDGNIIFNASSSVSVSGVDGNVQIVAAGASIWNFGTDGTTSLPGGINASDNLTLQVSGIPNAVTGLTGSPTGGWSGSYTNLSTTGGSGTGLTVNASESGSGYIDTVTINTPGHGYSNGDTITITNGGATAYFTISILPAKNWTFDGYGNLTFPDSSVQTTAYAGPQIHQTTVTLTPSDLAGLNQYPGKTLVSGGGLASNQVIVVTALEFSLTYNTTPYTTTANLYLNYGGNYLTVAQAIPAGSTTKNNTSGMLTASRNTYRYVQNGIADGNFPPQQDVILMADNNILDGDSDLRVKVTYIITTLF